MALLTHFVTGETVTIKRKVEPLATVDVYFAGPSTQHLTGTADASGWVTIAGSTDGWQSGNYILEIWQTVDGVKTVLSRQSVTAIPSASGIDAGQDMRTVAQRAVDNIESIMAGTASTAVKKYKINNRELENYSAVELLSLLKYWRNRLAEENRKAHGNYRLGPRIVTRI